MSQIDLKALFALTLRRPAVAAEELIALNLPVSARVAFSVLISALAGILAWLTAQMVGVADEGAPSLYGQIADDPLILAGVQFVALVFAAWLMGFVGGLMGGQGQFQDALILAAWIEAVLLVVQLLQLALLFVLPGYAALLGLIAVVLSLYLMVQFTKALHGFRSGWKVLFVIIATVFAMGFFMSFLLAAFGLFPEAPA